MEINPSGRAVRSKVSDPPKFHAKGSGRAAFQGSVAEVASDIRRVKGLGAAWVTFDLPRAGVPAMERAMERLAREVKPAAG